MRTACAAQADQAPAELAALIDGGRAAAERPRRAGGGAGGEIGSSGELVELPRAAAVPRPDAGDARARAGGHSRRPRATAAGGTAAAPRRGAAPRRPPRRRGAARTGSASREEVIACLDRIIEFYDRTEPASPVPFLARRMRRMVPMDFLELMEDLAPSGLKEFRSLAGTRRRQEDRRTHAR